MDLSEKLRYLRYAHDYSKAYVAYKLGISTEDYTELEEGERSLSLSQIEMISALYYIDPSEIFERNELLERYHQWEDLLEESDPVFHPDNCAESLIYLKAELGDIKEMLRTLVEKLDATERC